MEPRNKEYRNRIARTVALMVLGSITIAALAFSYIQHEQKKEFVAKALEERKASEQYVMDAFTRIEDNLERIRTHEGLIRENLEADQEESSMSLEERIHFEIGILEQLMEENQQIISGLNQELDSKNSLLAAYEKSIRDLKGRIENYKVTVEQLAAEKEAISKELASSEEARENLEQDVMMLTDEISQKKATIEEKEQMIVDRENALNTAYFTVGSFKELREKEIVEKEGGILGIASAKTVSPVLDPAEFQKVDIREVTVIPVMAGRAEVITNHDPASYSFEYNDEKIKGIVITDPARFWEKSKYLVVVVRDKESDELAYAR